jgi:predicted Zn-dependent peptidase
MASQMSYFESVAGDWRYLSTYLDKKFTTEDVKRVAKTYLTPANRTTAVLESE